MWARTTLALSFLSEHTQDGSIYCGTCMSSRYGFGSPIYMLLVEANATGASQRLATSNTS
jgi:hypothetical protein